MNPIRPQQTHAVVAIIDGDNEGRRRDSEASPQQGGNPQAETENLRKLSHLHGAMQGIQDRLFGLAMDLRSTRYADHEGAHHLGFEEAQEMLRALEPHQLRQVIDSAQIDVRAAQSLLSP